MKPYYEDDAVTIYHGDCREITEWLAGDVLVTDPPYGIGYVSGGPRINGFGVRSTSAKKVIASDTTLEARDEVLGMWGNRPALVFGSWKMPRPTGTRQRLLWIKANTTPALGGTPWSSADEEIYVLGDGWTGPRDLNIYRTNEARAGTGGAASQIGHPTPKPVPLMRWLLERCSPEAVAVDPFAGSGSTLLAAKDMGRKAIGVELEERYCEIAAKRVAQEVLAL